MIADLIDRNKFRFLCCILIDSFNNSTYLEPCHVASQFTPRNSRINRRFVHFLGKDHQDSLAYIGNIDLSWYPDLLINPSMISNSSHPDYYNLNAVNDCLLFGYQ